MKKLILVGVLMVAFILLSCAGRNRRVPIDTGEARNQEFINAPVHEYLATWTLINSEYDFRQFLESNQKLVILFGAEWCHNCKTVKEWWEEKGVSDPSWEFAYWEWKRNIPAPEIFSQVFRLLGPQDNPEECYLPIAGFIENYPGDGKLYYSQINNRMDAESPNLSFMGYYDATISLRKYLER